MTRATFMPAVWRMQRRRQEASRRSLIAIGFLLAGCVGSGEGVPIVVAGDGTAPQDAQEVIALLDGRCAQTCHRGGAAPKGLSLEANRSFSLLVGVPSVEVPGLLRVAPGQAAKSYLVAKIAAVDPRRVGSRMPRGGPTYLSGAQVRAIKRWIDAGATMDWVDADDTEDDVLRVPPPPLDSQLEGDVGGDSS